MTGKSGDLVIAIGELVVDWLATEKGSDFLKASTYEKSLGGNAANVAVGLSRLGSRVKVVARVGDDVQGRFLRTVLDDEGVDTTGVLTEPHCPTANCYVFTTQSGDNTFLNWPRGNAAEMLDEDDIDAAMLAGVDVIHATGISLTKEPRKSAIIKALKLAASKGAAVSFDAGFPTGEGQEGKDAARRAMSLTDILKINLFELVFWCKETGIDTSDIPREATLIYEDAPASGHEASTCPSMDRLASVSDDRIVELARQLINIYKPQVVTVTLAERGSIIVTRDFACTLEALSVDTVAGVGAGDAFVAGFIHALMKLAKDRPTREMLESIGENELTRAGAFASAAGALATTTLSASSGLPRESEVKQLISRQEAHSK